MERVGYLSGKLSLYDNMKANQFFKMYTSLQKMTMTPPTGEKSPTGSISIPAGIFVSTHAGTSKK
jgi:hypothetical protein